MPKKNKNVHESSSKIKLPIFGRDLFEVCKDTMYADKLLVPGIVRDITLFLEYSGALNNVGIYRISGTKSKVDALKGFYDNHVTVNLSDFDVTVLTSALKLYFRMLPEPLIPPSENIDISNIVKVLRNLPPYNYQTLSWLLSHLKVVVSKASDNKMTISNIAIVFCPTLHIQNDIFIQLIQKYTEYFGSIRPSHNKSLFKYISCRSNTEDFLNECSSKESSQTSILITNSNDNRISSDYDEIDIFNTHKNSEESIYDFPVTDSHERDINTDLSHDRKIFQSYSTGFIPNTFALENEIISTKNEINKENEKIKQLREFLNNLSIQYTDLLNDNEIVITENEKIKDIENNIVEIKDELCQLIEKISILKASHLHENNFTNSN